MKADERKKNTKSSHDIDINFKQNKSQPKVKACLVCVAIFYQKEGEKKEKRNKNGQKIIPLKKESKDKTTQ